MTEDEAKTKWCPFARWKFSALNDSSASNREGGHGDDGRADNPWLVKGTRCIASACMAWRWEIVELNHHGDIGRSQSSGGCGLAGAPQ